MEKLNNFNWILYDKSLLRRKMIPAVFSVGIFAFASIFILYLSLDFLLIQKEYIYSIICLFVFLFSLLWVKYFYNDLISTIQDVNYYIMFLPIFTLKENFITNKLEQMLRSQQIKYKKIKVNPIINYPMIVYHLSEINIFLKLKNSDFVDIHKHSIRIGPLSSENEEMIENIMENIEKLQFETYKE
jgi:hypothetical protein